MSPHIVIRNTAKLKILSSPIHDQAGPIRVPVDQIHVPEDQIRVPEGLIRVEIDLILIAQVKMTLFEADTR
jgi:hypothetical protein